MFEDEVKSGLQQRMSRRGFIGKSAIFAAGVPSVAALIAACGGSASTGTSSGPKIQMTFTHAVAADSPDGLGARYLQKRLGELTSNQVTMNIFDMATLATDAQAITALQSGSIDVAAITIYTTAVKAASVLDLPYLFTSLDAIQKALAGPAGQTIKDSAAGTGLKVLGWWIGGFRDCYGSKPMNSISDFKGMKIRTLQTPTYVAFFKAIGALPTPMDFNEVYLALQQHTIDAAETALPSMVNFKHYEVSKYVSLTHHGLSAVGVLASEKQWNSWPKNVQDALQKAVNDSMPVQRQDYDTTDAITNAFLKGKGMTIEKPDLAPMESIAKAQVYPQLVTDPTQKKILDQIYATK